MNDYEYQRKNPISTASRSQLDESSLFFHSRLWISFTFRGGKADQVENVKTAAAARERAGRKSECC